MNTRGKEFRLPTRVGAKPSVTRGIPHVQTDQTSGDELLERMAGWAFSLDGVEEQPSQASLPGARALTVAPGTFTARREAMLIGREFAHIHPQPYGGSMHLRLPADQVTEVVDKGWGEHHPFAVDGSVPNLLMVYAPRSEEDLEVVKIIISAAVEYASASVQDE